MDGCGVCGGDGVAVDVSGRCCSTALSPSNVCCGSSGSDSCGVCSGLNACAAIVRMQVADTDGMLSAGCAVCGVCHDYALMCVPVWNVTLFLESALGVDASLVLNMSLTSTGTAGIVRVPLRVAVFIAAFDSGLDFCTEFPLCSFRQMLLEFTLSSQARMPNWFLLRQLYSGWGSGTAPPGNVTVQSTPSIQRSFGQLIVALLSRVCALFAGCVWYR